MDDAAIVLISILVWVVGYQVGKTVEGTETFRDCREFGNRETNSGKWIDCSIRLRPPSEDKK